MRSSPTVMADGKAVFRSPPTRRMDERELLIAYFRIHPMLYDKNHVHYSQRSVKVAAWYKIQHEMENRGFVRTVDKWKDIMRNIIDSYKKYKRTYQTQLAQSETELPEPKWLHYQRMKFIDGEESTEPCIEVEISSEVIVPTNDTSASAESPSKSESQESSPQKTSLASQADSSTTLTDTTATHLIINGLSPHPVPFSTSDGKIKLSAAAARSLMDLVNTAPTVNTSPAKKQKVEHPTPANRKKDDAAARDVVADVNQGFAMEMMNQLKTLSARQQAKVKLDILNLLYEARFGNE